LGVVVWIDEVGFIKSKGTRMPRIARIRADLEVSDLNLSFLAFINFALLISGVLQKFNDDLI
jgi:hypothetical protein